MSMDAFLAEYYGTKTASAEDLEKQAQAELFAKLAAHNGIDLEQLSPEQVQYLWDETFSKTASDDDADPEKKVQEAKEEHDKKKEAMAKVAEADFLGRVMAHSLVNELRSLDKTAADIKIQDLRKAKGFFGRAGQLLSGTRRDALKGNVDEIRSITGVSEKGRRVLDAMSRQHKDEARKVLAARAGAAAGGAALVGGGVAAGRASKDKEKKSSALDELAAEQAVIKAAEYGFDADEAGARVSAVLTLGVEESTKIAQVQDLAGAVDVRALELLEAAGYPVNWG